MAPKLRLTSEEYLEQFPEHKTSSVLFLLYPSDEKTYFVLIERTSGDGVHSGQISLPGGKHEAGDKSYWNTAVRETEEEIGVNKKEMHFAGQLTDLFIPASKFRVYPHVGYILHTAEFVPNKNEVKKVIHADLKTFLSGKTKFEKEFITSYGKLPAPYFKYQDYEIWGATAMIISEFISLFKSENN
ncbi:MAG: NUDIX hydrolase [Bacteroidia bacterium]